MSPLASRKVPESRTQVIMFLLCIVLFQCHVENVSWWASDVNEYRSWQTASALDGTLCTCYHLVLGSVWEEDQAKDPPQYLDFDCVPLKLESINLRQGSIHQTPKAKPAIINNKDDLSTDTGNEQSDSDPAAQGHQQLHGLWEIASGYSNIVSSK